MFGTIYVGLSGLNAYSQGLKAVSNNVSNLNTVGFKSSDITFSDIYGQGSSGGLEYGSSQEPGGHGVTVNPLSVDFTQGEFRETGRDLDLSVDGNGFFVLLDDANTYYTRTGSFEVNDDGFIVLQDTDYKLAVLDDGGRPAAVNIDEFRTDPPVATDRITFSDNLSSTATEFNIPDVSVYDERGEESLWSLSFTRLETEFDRWTLTVTDATGTEVGSQSLLFDGGQVAEGSEELLFEDPDNGLSITFEFGDTVTSFSSGTVSSLRAADVAGYATGSIATLQVNDEGAFEITYTNNEERVLGSIALADFRDPQSLEQRSKALFSYSGFGQRQLLTATDERVGAILGGQLEASNVDLGSEFGDLILIQRGFQASSQIISVTNDMIQQLFGIRGQG